MAGSLIPGAGMLERGFLSRILFPAPPASYSADSFPHELIWVPRHENGRPGQEGSRVPCLLLTYPSARFLVIFFHSNAEDLGRCRGFCCYLREQFQVHVLAVEYPGYGVCPGVPTGDSVMGNAFAALRFAREHLDWPLDSIKVFGRSIGTGPAVGLAAAFPFAGIILVTPFLSVQELFRDRVGLLAGFVEEWFSNETGAPKISSPTLIIHGQRDELIACRHGELLFKQLKCRKLLISPPDMEHNTNLLTNLHMFVLPMFQFFALPDYVFHDMEVPAWAYHRPPRSGRQFVESSDTFRANTEEVQKPTREPPGRFRAASAPHRSRYSSPCVESNALRARSAAFQTRAQEPGKPRGRSSSARPAPRKIMGSNSDRALLAALRDRDWASEGTGLAGPQLCLKPLLAIRAPETVPPPCDAVPALDGSVPLPEEGAASGEEEEASAEVQPKEPEPWTTISIEIPPGRESSEPQPRNLALELSPLSPPDPRLELAPQARRVPRNLALDLLPQEPCSRAPLELDTASKYALGVAVRSPRPAGQLGELPMDSWVSTPESACRALASPPLGSSSTDDGPPPEPTPPASRLGGMELSTEDEREEAIRKLTEFAGTMCASEICSDKLVDESQEAPHLRFPSSMTEVSFLGKPLWAEKVQTPPMLGRPYNPQSAPMRTAHGRAPLVPFCCRGPQQEVASDVLSPKPNRKKASLPMDEELLEHLGPAAFLLPRRKRLSI